MMRQRTFECKPDYQCRYALIALGWGKSGFECGLGCNIGHISPVGCALQNNSQYPVTNLKPVDTNGNIDQRSCTTGVGLLSELSGRRISDRARSIRRLHNRVAILGGCSCLKERR